MQLERVDAATEVVDNLRLLELFSGTGSIGRSFRARGWDVTAIDNDPTADATICCDIASWNVDSLQGNRIDAIWASPPCTNYSTLRSSSTEEDRMSSDKLVNKNTENRRGIGGKPTNFH